MLESLRLLPTDRSEWLIPVGFTVCIVLIVGVGIAIESITTERPALLQIVYQPILFPGMFTIAPFILAATNMLRGASLLTSVSVGVAPGFAFLLLGWGSKVTGIGSSGDAPAWVLAVVFAQVGLGRALIGAGAGVVIQRICEWNVV